MNTPKILRLNRLTLLGLMAVACAPALAQSADEMRQRLGLNQPTGAVAKGGIYKPPPPRASMPDTQTKVCPGQIPSPGQSAQADAKATVISLQAEPVPYVEVPVGTLDIKPRFDFASSAVDPRDLPQLRILAGVLREPNSQAATFAIAGHTDDSGDDAWNDKLSCDRALRVRQVLIDAGVSPDRLTAYGWGSRRLIGNLPADHPSHRRVEVRRAR